MASHNCKYYGKKNRKRNANGCATIASMFAKPSTSSEQLHSVTLFESASADRAPELEAEAEQSASPQPLPNGTTGPLFTGSPSSETVKK